MNNSKILLPQAQGCTLTYPCVDSETLVRELIFTYRCNADCGNCHLPIINQRTMPVELTLDTVKESVDYARKNGYKRLQLYLIGGEALHAFESLKDFYDKVQGVEELNKDITITIFIETCGRNLSDECKQWLLEKISEKQDSRDLHLILRWDSLNNFTKDKIWQEEKINGKKYPDFWKLMTGIITLRLEKENFTAENITTLYNNVIYINSLSKLRGVNYYFDMSSVDARKYCKLINTFILKGVNFDFFCRSIEGCSCKEGEKKNIETIDFNGDRYPCRYLSPAYHLSGVYSQDYTDFERPDSCKSCIVADKCYPCPAAMARTSTTQCIMMRRLCGQR